MVEALNMGAIPIYNKEMSPSKMQGQGSVMGKFVFTSGALVSTGLAINLPPLGSDKNPYWWRIMYGVPIIIAAIRFICLAFVFSYETPKYLQL
jgi:hypothetical protein